MKDLYQVREMYLMKEKQYNKLSIINSYVFFNEVMSLKDKM